MAGTYEMGCDHTTSVTVTTSGKPALLKGHCLKENTLSSESEPPEDQIDQLQRVISEKEEENKALKDRVKELESAGRRMEEACQCLPKPPNTTGLVPTKV